MKNTNKVLWFFVIIVILLSSTSFLQATRKKPTAMTAINKNKQDIRLMLNEFISSCRRKDFSKAYQYTTGKEKKVYAAIINNIKAKNGNLPLELKAFFERLKEFKVDVVELDKSLDIAVAICTFQFRYYDSKSYDEVRKYREVFYYLKKVNKKWKITYSKLNNEHYYYRSKSNKKIFKKY